MARYSKLVRDALPPIPPEDAPCHKGLCPQARCANCLRIIGAHHALDILYKLETLYPPDTVKLNDQFPVSRE